MTTAMNAAHHTAETARHNALSWDRSLGRARADIHALLTAAHRDAARAYKANDKAAIAKALAEIKALEARAEAAR